MPNPEQITGRSTAELPTNVPASVNKGGGDNAPLNPLFQPETLAKLTKVFLREIQNQELEKTPPNSVDTRVTSIQSLDVLSTLSIPNTPHFYFLEGLAPASTEISRGIKQPSTIIENPHPFAYSAPIDPFFAPHINQELSFFDVHSIRQDFPILQERVNGKPLVWFDNAATTQKPRCVIDRLTYFYEHENSNVHRAAHELAARSTDAYEGARETVRRFLNAAAVNEIIFVRGTTEGINLIAKSWGQQNLQAGDEIVLTHLEHHANIVPWQQLAQQTGAKLRVIPVDNHGQILLEEYQQLLNSRTKLVAFSHVSNALGTITPAKEIIDLAHRVGAKVLLDAAQSVSHIPLVVSQVVIDG
jgi:cysteine desulfurase/selenocysteine lyase